MFWIWIRASNDYSMQPPSRNYHLWAWQQNGNWQWASGLQHHCGDVALGSRETQLRCLSCESASACTPVKVCEQYELVKRWWSKPSRINWSSFLVNMKRAFKELISRFKYPFVSDIPPRAALCASRAQRLGHSFFEDEVERCKGWSRRKQ
jgi:hypothetical protein